jgi:hypothetical protein
MSHANLAKALRGSGLVENAEPGDDEVRRREVRGQGNVLDVAGPHQRPDVRIVKIRIPSCDDPTKCLTNVTGV